jgi:hypothetical protein
MTSEPSRTAFPIVTEPSAPYAEYGVATFTDALAASPLGLNIRQQSYEMGSAPER